MSNEYAIARHERETDPAPLKRPWIVRWRVESYRSGKWGTWTTYGTYKSEAAAKSVALKLTTGTIEARFCHRDLLAEVKDYEVRTAADERDGRGRPSSAA